MNLFGKTIIFLLAAFSIVLNDARAQVCQGSLGDPLINITFGAGANPGPPLAAATTGYQYLAGDCPNDGLYTVRSNTTNCFNNSWHSLSADHTGDPNGYFMLVNASIQPSAFYLDTVKGLCSSTTYEFAAWIANVLRSTACGSAGIQPNLTFTIEGTNGTIFQSYNTGNIPNLGAPSWQQLGFFFATPAGVSDIVLKIANNSPGGCGNDIALDDITFRPCGPQLTASIAGNNTGSVTICEGTSQSFALGGIVSPGFNNPIFLWQESINGGPWTDISGSAGNATYIVNILSTTPPGTYAYRLSAAEAANIGSVKCRVSSPPITIKVSGIPENSASINSPICEKNTLTMSASGGTTYQWTGPNNFSASGATASIPNAQAINSGKYFVLVTNADNCSLLDSVIAVVNINPVATTPFSEARICEGDNVMLESSGGDSYTWIPATGLSSAIISNPVASPADTTVYTVVVTNQFGCHDTAGITVNVVERPKANAGPDKYIVKGKSAQLQGVATGQGISYSWSPALYIDNVQSLQPIVNPPEDTTYQLTVVSNEGCGVATDFVRVHIYPAIYVPTAFSPNNDGLNDTWSIPALRAYSEFTVSIYNRYGQLIFYTKNNLSKWDGKYNGLTQPAGVYVYMVAIKDEELLKGTLMLVR